MAIEAHGSKFAAVRLLMKLDVSIEGGKKQETELVEAVADTGSGKSIVELSELAKSLARLRVQSNRTLTALIDSHGVFETGKEKKVLEKLQASLADRAESDEEDDEQEADED